MNKIDKSKLKKRTIKGVISFFIRSVFIQGFGFITNFFIGKYLDSKDFGIYGLVANVVGTIAIVSDIGITSFLIQKKKEPTLKEYRTIFTVQFLLSILIVLFSLGYMTFNDLSYLKEDLLPTKLMFIALSLVFVFSSLRSVSQIKLERSLLFSKLVFPQIISQVLYNSFLLIFAKLGFHVYAYVYAILVRDISHTILIFLMAPWKIGFNLDVKNILSLLKKSYHFQLIDLIARVKDNLYFLWVQKKVSLSNFGYVIWAKSWSMQPYNLTVQNIMAITFPAFSRVQHDEILLKRAIEKVLFFISIIVFPLVFGMSIFILPVLNHVPGYGKYMPALLSFILFTISIAWAAISSPLINTLNAIGKTNIVVKLMGIWTFLTWGLSFILFPFFDYNTVAIVNFLVSCTSILTFIEAKKIINFRFFESIKLGFLSSILMSIFAIFYNLYFLNSVFDIFIGIFLSAVVYLISLILIDPKTLIKELKSLL